MPELELDWFTDGPTESAWHLLLAHGAGQSATSDFMQGIVERLADKGFRIHRFEFPYMRKMRQSGKKRPPDREPVLLATFQHAIAHLEQAGIDKNQLIIGGKSMGGRIASQIADAQKIAGLVCLGFPFHAPGKPTQVRDTDLKALKTPCLICQGERDPFGNRLEVKNYQLSDQIQVEWLTDGEHSFKPRKHSGVSEADNFTQTAEAITKFISHLNPSWS